MDNLLKPAITPVDETAPEITLNNENYSYTIGDSVDIGCTAYDDVDGSVPCTYTGSIDTNTLGDYDITYSATDSSGNTNTLIITYSVVEEIDYLAMDLDPYYDNAEGLSGETLLIALRTIINDYTFVSYDDARYILDETDQDPNNPNNIILVYTQSSVSGTWDAGATWNREHVWPQSLLGYDSTMSADLHNLKPADPGENSSRSNKYFDYIGSTTTYEPPDEVKGDIARILFYMIVMYDYLDLVDTEPTTYEMGLLEVLLAWHDQDPVDDFERNRNDVIYSYQNNRNPFIDYEHFVEMIFGSHSYYNN
ncbi:MAG: endonuclease [Candidatus Izimaplasma sp.]|nr:endonuclease [Candidatus Izimaplasma bacterium]